MIFLLAEELEGRRRALRARDPRTVEAYARLVAEADSVMQLEPISVTEKPTPAPSGNLHDFYAIGGYSWPNPETADGMPYIYRDSEPNPEAYESASYDKGRLAEMIQRVSVLTLAWFHSGDNKYAEHAILLLRVWFLDDSTRMNPNFRHAAARPGVWDGHFSGLIECTFLIELIDYVVLLEGSPLWTQQLKLQLQDWFLDLSDWLCTSPFGRREIFSPNNHSSYLLASIAAFATYGSKHDRARRAITLARTQLRRQIRADGVMPHEVDRPDGWFYSIYGLRAFTVLARIGTLHGYDLWNEGAPTGGTARIASSLSLLSDCLTGSYPWLYSIGNKPWRHDAAQAFRIGSRAYSSENLRTLACSIEASSDSHYPDMMRYTPLQVSPPDQSVLSLVTPKTGSATDAKMVRTRLSLALEKMWRIVGRLASWGVWPSRRFSGSTFSRVRKRQRIRRSPLSVGRVEEESGE